MDTIRIGRRATMLGLAATLPALRARAAATVTDALVSAANKEGTLTFHTSIELKLAEKMAGLFQKKYPSIRVQLERTGAERILQRISQEYSSNIFEADVVESSDTGMFVDWKKRGWLADYMPEVVAKNWPETERDPDGRFASVRASLSVLSRNTRQVKEADAPRGFEDLLQPKWRMRLVKAHPSYSGTILTSTYATVKALGWGYMEKLAKQRVMQVQSATEPPKKVGQGERSVAVDGSEYVVLMLKAQGEPIEPIYAVEGSPLFSGQVTVMEKAAHPNAARLFDSFLFSLECQQMMADDGFLRSFHPDVKDTGGRKPLSQIKLLRSTAAELAAHGAEIKQKYAAVFGV